MWMHASLSQVYFRDRVLSQLPYDISGHPDFWSAFMQNGSRQNDGIVCAAMSNNENRKEVTFVYDDDRVSCTVL